MKLIFVLSFFVSYFAFANGFVCKEDMRPGDGVYSLVSLREENGKYSMFYLELSDGVRRVDREEQILFQNAKCFTQNTFAGICKNLDETKVLAKFGVISGRVVIQTETKQFDFNLKDCYKN